MTKVGNLQEFIALPLLKEMVAVLLYPEIEVKTSDSRSILKESIPVKLASRQIAHMGSFVASLYLQDVELFKAAMQDVIIEPMRSMLIPKFTEMKKAVIQNGALAFGISGSGPSVFTIVQGHQKAVELENHLKEIYEQTDVNFKTYVSPINNNSGARILNI